MFKEYGGYLPIELSSGRPFYDGKNVVSLNAGRYAIVYAIEDAGWKQIWLPYYLCNTVADSIRICLPQVKIDYYHINCLLYTSQETPEFIYRLKVKAGLTGYAQIYGKYNTTPLDKLKLDLMYIESYSVLLDIRLIFLTLKIMFTKESTCLLYTSRCV